MNHAVDNGYLNENRLFGHFSGLLSNDNTAIDRLLFALPTEHRQGLVPKSRQLGGGQTLRRKHICNVRMATSQGKVYHKEKRLKSLICISYL